MAIKRGPYLGEIYCTSPKPFGGVLQPAGEDVIPKYTFLETFFSKLSSIGLHKTNCVTYA